MDPYYRIEADGAALDCFWRCCEERFDRNGASLEILHVAVGGLTVRIECRSAWLLKYLAIQFACSLVSGSERPDAVFRLWHDEIGACLPAGCPVEKVLVMRGSCQALKAEVGRGRLHGFDRERRVGYFCLRDGGDEAVIEQGYLLYRLFYELAKNRGRIVLHGAVIGYENRGALICGNCGYGKSTLAVSSLLEGCQYVGDDRAMFTQEGGDTRAWPIYSIASLDERILGRLPQLRVGARWLKSASMKNVFGISAYRGQFSHGLPIRVLMMPKLSLDLEEPSVVQIDAGPVLTHLIWSTITQVDDRKDTAHIRRMVDFFKGLPCYKIELCADVEKNAKFLKTHMHERIGISC